MVCELNFDKDWFFFIILRLKSMEFSILKAPKICCIISLYWTVLTVKHINVLFSFNSYIKGINLTAFGFVPKTISIRYLFEGTNFLKFWWKRYLLNNNLNNKIVANINLF